MSCENCGAVIQIGDEAVYACPSCGYEFEGAVSSPAGMDYVVTSYAKSGRKRKHVCRGTCRKYETHTMASGVAYCNTCDKYMRLDDTSRCPCCGNIRLRHGNRRCKGIKVARY